MYGGGDFKGIIPILREYRGYTDDEGLDELAYLLGEVPCSLCGGRRLREEALAVKIKGKGIGDIVALSCSEALKVIFRL